MKITICGPAAAGKGTIARRFAAEAGIGYVDLGLLFRLGAFVLASGKITRLGELPILISSGDVAYVWTGEKAAIYWQEEDVTVHLLNQEVAHQTSVLASGHAQQSVLTEIANCVLGTFDSVVCDGRNAGSTILPDADHKFFITARLEERARRRHLDILHQGGSVTYEEVLREVENRDRRDAERATYPLIVPRGAIILETDTRSVEESVRFMWETIRREP